MLYPDAYVWLVFLSALDVMLTWITLAWGGMETNALARPIIAHLGLVGIVIFKFALIVLVIVICESVGRRSNRAGRRFATAGQWCKPDATPA